MSSISSLGLELPRLNFDASARLDSSLLQENKVSNERITVLDDIIIIWTCSFCFWATVDDEAVLVHMERCRKVDTTGVQFI